MALTKVDILNIALDRIGAKGIVAETDQHESARVALRHYTFILNDLLTRHDWSFAKKGLVLSATATTPINGFAYEHALPGDFLHVVTIVPQGKAELRSPQHYEYEIHDGYIYTNVSPIYLLYLSNNVLDNPHKFPPYFGPALALAIAASMIPVFEPSQAGIELYTTVAERALKKAIWLDSRMKSRMKIPTGVTQRARLGYTNAPWSGFPDPNYNLYPWNAV